MPLKKIAIIAGEASGDILGSRLIHSLKKQLPDVQFEGIGGKEMQQAGCHCLYPMEHLAVMGFAEVLSRLPSLLRIRRNLLKRWQANPPDLMIGIDAPDFNLTVERILHHAGIPSVHYVSPSVWAWRSHRVKKIQGNLDLMLTLFPFEVDFYHQHNIAAEFVGHPLADEIPLPHEQPDLCQQARIELGIAHDAQVLALLAGSRRGEVERLSSVFLQAATQLQQTQPNLHIITPLVNEQIAEQFNAIKQQTAPNLSLQTVIGQSRTVMAAADHILMASGTAVLEGMLFGKPMLAAYKVAPFTAWLIRRFKMMQVEHFTLPNNLANEVLVPELIQENVTVEQLVQGLQALFNEPTEQAAYRQQRFQAIHQQLRQNASERAAQLLIERFA